MAEKVLALVRYYAREGFAKQLQTVCNEVLKQRSNEAQLVFWRAVGMLMEGSTSEALRELQAVSQVSELRLAAAAAMVQAHEAAKVVDQDAVMELQTILEAEEDSVSDQPALNLALYYSLSGSKERARSLVDRVLRAQPDNRQALVLMAWVIISQVQDPDFAGLVDESELEEAHTHCVAALDVDPQDLEAMMARAKVGELRGQLAAALESLTEVTIRFPWFMPARVEKVRVLLLINDWEQANELIAQILASDSQNILALAWQALQVITRQGSNSKASKLLQDLLSAINRTEPRNAALYYSMARRFGRLAGSEPSLLAITSTMCDRACQLRPEYAPYLVEAGYQKLFLEELVPAAERFGAAQTVDELSLEASCGALEASILQGELEEAEGALGFLQEMFASQAALRASSSHQGEPAVLRHLRGLLAWRQGNTAEGVSQFEAVIAMQLEAASKEPISLDMFVMLNPGLIIRIVKLLLASAGGEPKAPTEAPSPLATMCSRALELLAKHAPAMAEAQVLAARAAFLVGNLGTALRKAQDLLRNNPDEAAVHLLICNVYLHQGKLQEATSALEQAVSANFAVREMPGYHVASAKVLLGSGKLEEARKVLEAAMALPGVRSVLTAQQRARLVRRGAEPTLYERASVYLLLAEVLSKLSKAADAPEATKYITDATREFEGTSEEVRVTIADSELAIAREDVEGALKKLRRIPKTSPHYAKARMAMADIYLKHRKNKAAYIKCYMDLVELQQDYDSYCMLGEAFMQIQEPEKAVRAFESALEEQPKELDLMLRIARALVTTHDYARAIDYYNKALFQQSRANWWLQLELAGLLVRLRQWGKALMSLQGVLERPDVHQSVDALSLDVEAWTGLAKVYKGNGDLDNFLESLGRALDLQKALVARLRGELPETVQAARDKAASICYDLAEHHRQQRQSDKAIEMYQDALRHSDSHNKSMLALARLYLADGNLDACQQQCVQLLKHYPEDEEASIMLAELMFHKEHFDNAIYHFQQLLERNPTHWVALSQLIMLLRRAGRLDDVPKYITAAEGAAAKSTMDAGLHYCKGLLARYTNKPREALSEFNLARKDSSWGAQALMHMAEVYLNPDNDLVWEDKDNLDTPESREALATARSLLEQVRPQDQGSQRYQVLQCYARMSTKEPAQVDQALNTLMEMGNQDPNNVPVLLAMAHGFMLLKQTPKARNQLKRVQKLPYKPDEAEEFERAWLLLADIHIQGGKFDLAQDLCQKCLKYNKSCAKAWECLGSVMEREQSFKDAAEHYEKAWRHESQSSAVVGYKLAFNYLKAERFVEAIDVCHKVIKAFPDYPGIRREVLDKARLGLKP